MNELHDRLRAAIPIVDGDADVWGLFRDPSLAREVLSRLASHFDGKVDKICGVESRGFIVGMALAMEMKLPFVGIRKDTGFFPGETIALTSSPDYRGNTHSLRLQVGALDRDDRVLLADDWIETGNQAMCVKGLIEQAGAELYGVATIVDQCKPERQAELGAFVGLITNAELFAGTEQRDYQSEAAGA